MKAEAKSSILNLVLNWFTILLMINISIFSLSFLLITLIATIGIFIETFTYSGLIRSHLLFDIRILVIISITLAISNLLRKIPDKLPLPINQANKFLVLSITAILTILFTVMELVNYPNYIFSTFHLNYDSFFYLFILSFSVFIFSINKNKLIQKKELSIFVISVILVIAFGVIRTWPGGIFFIFIKEDNIFENLQFVFYFFSALMALAVSINALSKNKLLFLYFLGFSLFLFFIAGEEISWGQRVFGISTPEIAREINTQEETTIHNIRGLNDLQPIMYYTFSFYLSTAWIFLKALPKKIQHKIKIFIPEWYFMLFFLPIFTFYAHINILGGSHWEWQEACELMLAIGLFIFMFEKVRETRNK